VSLITRHQQRLSVSFDYPVYFLRGLFDAQPGPLVEALTSREPDRRHRLAVVIDRGVAQAWPHLAADLGGHVRAHSGSSSWRRPRR